MSSCKNVYPKVKEILPWWAWKGQSPIKNKEAETLLHQHLLPHGRKQQTDLTASAAGVQVH